MNHKTRDGILGDWLSSWFDPSVPGGWVTERVKISGDTRNVVLENDTDSGDYLWHGSGELFDGLFFCGMWRSRTHGFRPLGVFSFYVLPEGHTAVGQAFGPDREGSVTRYDWALGRTAESMSVAQKWIIGLPSPAIYHRSDLR